ncbi:hypothetical protein M408DRAFT_289384 [Serendipita vermifera MAFF 305830]|uniref:Uncharacterized protein n=1 Tax=Serendipita vermifera MAFF 305830 TaxID=933852 RepID=A0A0C3B1H9_SERVB|nr:hypothetical protein M408DRAFT_289384 [Serendipita vermifera MAFF 305830]
MKEVDLLCEEREEAESEGESKYVYLLLLKVQEIRCQVTVLGVVGALWSPYVVKASPPL